jgi:hypothetical protein
MIAFACVAMVVTCDWFNVNAMIVLCTHLFEIMLEVSHVPIVKENNNLKSQVTCQPGVMKQILDGCC